MHNSDRYFFTSDFRNALVIGVSECYSKHRTYIGEWGSEMKKILFKRKTAVLLILCFMLTGCNGSCMQRLFGEKGRNTVPDGQTVSHNFEVTTIPTVTAIVTKALNEPETQTEAAVPTVIPHSCVWEVKAVKEEGCLCERCGGSYTKSVTTTYECGICHESKEVVEEFVHVCEEKPTPVLITPTPVPTDTPVLTATPTNVPVVTALPTASSEPRVTATPTVYLRPTATVIPEIKGNETKTEERPIIDNDGKTVIGVETVTEYSSGMTETVKAFENGSMLSILTDSNGITYTKDSDETYTLVEYDDGTKIIVEEDGRIDYFSADGKSDWSVYVLPKSYNYTMFFRYTETPKDAVICNSDGSLNRWSGVRLDALSAVKYKNAIWLDWYDDMEHHAYYFSDGPFYDY